MGSIHRTFLVLASFTVCAVVLFLSYSGEQLGVVKPSHLKWLVDTHGYLLETSGCRIPGWDPYDPSVKPFFEKVSGAYKCPGRPPFLTAKFNAVVTLDETILTFYYGVTKDNISCTYRPILRDSGTEEKRTDNKFRFGDPSTLILNVPLKENFIQVTCFMGSHPPFSQYIPLVPIKKDVEMRMERTLKHQPLVEDALNVIVVGIDSISKLNFLRHFHKTYRFLKEKLAPIELKGYTKVADNTFPNLVPLLTGHFVEHYWNETMRDMFFDNIDLIWKSYSKHGYRTLMAEDAPNIATFNYLKRGFRNPPTDYYFRPFALAVEKSRMKQHSRIHCFQSRLEMDVLFNYLKDFAHTMGNRPHFAFTFVARLTHDKLNAAGFADEPTFQLLRDFQDSGILNKTLLILFSDHGIRFGPIRQTYIGKFEERMPFIFLLFPSWFLQKYPDVATNLRKNEGRLTTPFDIHATLVHLLNFTGHLLDDNATNPLQLPYGISLLHEIPEHRTCNDAGILPHWCPCQTHAPVAATDPIVINAAEVLIDTINTWVKPYANLCVPLRVSEIRDARIGHPNDEVLRFVRHVNDVINRQVVLGDKVEAPSDYLLTIMASPSGGIFEGTVRYEEVDGTYRVLDDISRINRYGNQSWCIEDARIRKFCFCREQFSHPVSRNSTDSPYV